MALKSHPECGFGDYLTVERETIDEKHEYVAGRVYAMTGTTFNHNLIVTNLAAELRTRLKGGPCTVLTNDMRLRIEAADACKYPDIVALCEEPRFYDDRRDVLTNPALVFEVLSPSTEAYDRGGKFAIYRTLPGLKEYVLIAQDRCSVEVFSRQQQDRWLLDAYDALDDEAVFDSLQCRVALSDIYDKVVFETRDSFRSPVSI